MTAFVMAALSTQADAAPAWTADTTAVAGALTFIALVVGGVVGFLRYWRGRILHAGCETNIKVRQIRVLGDKVLHVEVAVQNSGTVLLAFVRDAVIKVQIEAMTHAIWDDARRYGGDVLWSEGLFFDYDLLVTEDQERVGLNLEPNERFGRNLLVPVPAQGENGPFRVRVISVAYPWSIAGYRKIQVWAAETVVNGDEPHG